MDASDQRENVLPRVLEFFRAVADRRARWRALRDLGRTVGWWGLAGLAPTVIAATAQVYFLNLPDAWDRFGRWWVLLPLATAAVPIAFTLCLAALEGAVGLVFWAVFIVSYGIPSLLFGEQRAEAILRVLKALPLLAIAGFIAWIAWTQGMTSALPEHRAHAHGAPGTAWDFTWVSSFFGWIWTNPLSAGLLAFGLTVLRKILEKSGADLVSAALKSEPERVVRIYGPDERVVREISLENSSSRS